MFSRNTPIALLVGAAGFLGSHLAEALLGKNIQIIGVDNLSTGFKENLIKASEDKNFHFIVQSLTENPSIDLPRIDYAFFVLSAHIPFKDYVAAFESFLKVCKNFNSKIVLISSIDLYDLKKEGNKNLKEAERKLARFAADNNLVNARIVRLAAVFGPRMHFRIDDPAIRLIKAAIEGGLQQESAPLDFTTRSIYISDATNLLIKAVMHGATAQKIYDGALFYPVKVTEIKQILLDPLWYETRGFTPTELPPWPTPNLTKTQKELIWKPKVKLITALKETILFLKEHPEQIKTEEEGEIVESNKPHTHPLGEEDLETNRKTNQVVDEPKTPKGPNLNTPVIKFTKKYAMFLIGLSLIFYALIYPVIKLTFEIFDIKVRLQNTAQAISSLDFDRADQEIGQAQKEADDIQAVFAPLKILAEADIFQTQIQPLVKASTLASELVAAVSFSLDAAENLNQAVQIISGEEGNLEEISTEAVLNLDQADKKLNTVANKLSDQALVKFIPSPFQGRVEELRSKISFYQKEVNKAKSYVQILPQLVGSTTQKNYLILLEDNTNLKPGGGKIQAYGQVSFQQGKLADIKTGDVNNLDKTAKDAFQNSNLEADFSINAKLAQQLYKEQFKTSTDGVIFLDLKAVSSLLKVLGPIYLTEQKMEINGENLLPAVVSSKNSEILLEGLLKEFLNRTFFLSKQNWVSLSQTINQNLSEKHLMVYLSDPILFSCFNNGDQVIALYGQPEIKTGERVEFLSLSENNILENKSNYYLKRSIDLQSTINSNREVIHKLTITFASQDSPALYSSKLKIYLALGSKLTKATFGGEDVLGKITSFSDFGRGGYQMDLEVKPKGQETLILEYQGLKPLEFDGNRAKYKLDVIKQPGTGKDSLNFKLYYPSNLKIISNGGNHDIPQQISFSTSLTSDKSFEVVLEK